MDRKKAGQYNELEAKVWLNNKEQRGMMQEGQGWVYTMGIIKAFSWEQ